MGGRVPGQRPSVAAADARVVLQVVRLVEDQTRPGHPAKRVRVFAEDVVVDDHPLGRGGDRRRAFDDEHGCGGRHQRDLTRPVTLHRGRTDDEVRTAGRHMAERDDGLSRLAEAHVVGQDGAAAAEEEGDAIDLVRKEPVGQSHGRPERAVRVVRQAEEPGKRGRLRVERRLPRGGAGGGAGFRGTRTRVHLSDYDTARGTLKRGDAALRSRPSLPVAQSPSPPVPQSPSPPVPSRPVAQPPSRPVAQPPRF